MSTQTGTSKVKNPILGNVLAYYSGMCLDCGNKFSNQQSLKPPKTCGNCGSSSVTVTKMPGSTYSNNTIVANSTNTSVPARPPIGQRNVQIQTVPVIAGMSLPSPLPGETKDMNLTKDGVSIKHQYKKGDAVWGINCNKNSRMRVVNLRKGGGKFSGGYEIMLSMIEDYEPPGHKIDGIWANASLFYPISGYTPPNGTEDDRFPHKCPHCGGAAYIGLIKMECKSCAATSLFEAPVKARKNS